ncbi:fungal-specific transcription factor domain-containing protein [Aspergillus ambiguus]|uniref:putative C6 transcription factor n=1 Tax=Aspergillus ambiguus TaxID=176160 RepID=UPI003CCDE3A2
MSPRATADEPEQLENKDKIPACQSCRRKKAKCDREQPCSQCVKFDTICIYENGRLKPGLRAGAVEQLQRRMETLENMFIGQGIMFQKILDTALTGRHSDRTSGKEHISLSQTRDSVRHTMLDMAWGATQSPPRTDNNDLSEGDDVRADTNGHRASKRRRIQPPSTETQGTELDQEALPPWPVIQEIVEFYFAKVHHWIPILHVRRFRQEIETPEGRAKSIYILHAMVATCIRFASHPDAGDVEAKAHMARSSRQKVMLHSMESFSVKNLQALVIIAFDTIGSGKGPSAWSIIGSMSRTVEQLQLSVEESTNDSSECSGEFLIKRMVFLEPSQSWWQAEERRRVFWTVFLMDRFCSVSTGWNLSLTSADVKRRLPCEGSHWEKEQEVRTPLFGILDKRSGIPDSPRSTDNSLLSDSPVDEEIGGFAYCIEATESLTLVVNFFLHHALDLRDTQKAQIWLMKFKELDLRLVQWKLSLPSKWRDASVLNQDGIMDPNLTLAHITHNTALILLHQSIAYPPRDWKERCTVRLPSAMSAETCLEAASEISAVGRRFLHHSSIILNPQFSFCLFVAGRVLFTYSRYTGSPVANQLDTLIGDLLEISRRWAGPNSEKENLASVFAKRLLNARQHYGSTASTCHSLDIRQTAYSDSSEKDATHSSRETGPSLSNASKESEEHIPIGELSLHIENRSEGTHIGVSPSDSLHNSLSLAFPPLPFSLQQQFAPLTGTSPFDPSLFLPESQDPMYASLSAESLLPRHGAWTPISQSYNSCTNDTNDPRSDYPTYLPGSRSIQGYNAINTGGGSSGAEEGL